MAPVGVILFFLKHLRKTVSPQRGGARGQVNIPRYDPLSFSAPVKAAYAVNEIYSDELKQRSFFCWPIILAASWQSVVGFIS